MQRALFENIDDEYCSIEESAEILGVSAATIRNWVRLGYLRDVRKGSVSASSLRDFRSNVVGSEKLLARANKSHFDSHDHELLTQSFVQKLSAPGLGFDDAWIAEYEASLSNSYMNKEGVYYTPAEIAADFFHSLPKDVSNLVFCDPCCGGGVFLEAAIAKGFKPENVYGFDTDEVAVALTKKRLEKFGKPEIQVQDFLTLVAEGLTQVRRPDVIFTNPPWGKKLVKAERQKIAQSLNVLGYPDTCALFFSASLRLLKSEGFLGMLLPDSFFNVATFEATRQEALSQAMVKATDYGKPFKGLVTRAKGITIRKKDVDSEALVDCEPYKREPHTRKQAEFSSNPKSIINFCCSPKEAEVIALINQKQHITLKGNAKWALGIVTGNNKKFLQDKPAEDYIAVHKGSEIHPDKLDPATCYIPDDFDLYQQTPPREMFLAPEKIVYKFISSKLAFYLDTEQRYFLNSANMIVLSEGFPLSSKFMSAYLSSEFVNWYFNTMFETHKVLRADIEAIPIFPQFTSSADTFSESELTSNLGLERAKDGTYRIKK